MKGLFVTGTDTGVGKTVVAACVLTKLRAAGVDAVPMKPVQTGASRVEGAWRAPDLDFSISVAGLCVEAEEYALMAPCNFALPASPHLAAREEGRSVSLETMTAAAARLGDMHDYVVVEGAGGILVPFDEKTTMLDLVRRLALPVLLVARTNLGTINHTLLSVSELKRAGLQILGIVFCDCEPTAGGEPVAGGLIERDNRAIIARLSGCPILGHVPYLPGLDDQEQTPERFQGATAPHLPDGAALLKLLDAAQ